MKIWGTILAVLTGIALLLSLGDTAKAQTPTATETALPWPYNLTPTAFTPTLSPTPRPTLHVVEAPKYYVYMPGLLKGGGLGTLQWSLEGDKRAWLVVVLLMFVLGPLFDKLRRFKR